MANVRLEATPQAQGTLLVDSTIPEFGVHAGGLILKILGEKLRVEFLQKFF